MFEPKKVAEALEDPDWLLAMHEELNNFERNKVWKLVEKTKECCNVIGTKWIFKNKQDEHGMVVRNKARLVIRPFCITILYHNLSLLIDIFHNMMQYLGYFILFCMFGNYWGCICRSWKSAGKVPVKIPDVGSSENSRKIRKSIF